MKTMDKDPNKVFLSQAPKKGINKLKSLLYLMWWSLPSTRYLKFRRLKAVDRAVGGILFSGKKLKILEIGCGSGKDFITFLKDTPHELYGLDVNDNNLKQDNLKIVIGDAEKIDFPDKYFDLVVSFGVLEHIEPMEKLSRVCKEIDRVAKSYCMSVPSIGTLVEPHRWRLHWQLKAARLGERPLNYFTDITWTKFEGFSEAKVKRFGYIPFLIKNLLIFK